MRRLQAGLVHRQAGDLTSYGCQTDGLPMPRLNHRPIVEEIFGVGSPKRCDEPKSRKKAAGERTTDICFVSVESRLKSEDVIRWVESLMTVPANRIWRQPAATDAAA